MAYKHGTYGQFEKSVGLVATQSGTVAVYVGVAPVNLIKGYADKGIINAPVRLTGLDGARNTLGYSSNWDSFSLCEAFAAHFDNTIESVGPIVAINVLDPDVHIKDTPTTTAIKFVNGVAQFKSDTIILDTITIANAVSDVDYSVDYDFNLGRVIINKLSDSLDDDTNATYSEVDLTAVDKDDIIGGVTAGGVYTGLGCIGLIYPDLGLIPNLIVAPKYSEVPEVYAAMVKAAKKINGHWDAMVIADIPISVNDTIEEAIKWKSDNNYESEFSKVCFPQWQLKNGTIFHLSTLTTWLMVRVDATNSGVPMETPSNKIIPSGKQYFGADSTNRGYDQQTANSLNEKGITTAVFWGGENVLWGGHTAAYEYGNISDNRVIFDNSVRMMMHVSNSFQQEHALTIDKPMTRAMADTIRNREQEKADALAAIGALIGTPVVEFKESENSNDELVEGNFIWNNEITPTPPFKSGTIKVAYSTAGFSTYYEGSE